MNWDAIGAIGEMIGAVAVVATLIYLAAQIRQNTNATQATSRETVSQYTIDLLLQLSRDDDTVVFWRSALTDPTDLDPSARFRRDMIAYAVAEGWEMAYMQWRRGVLSDRDWEKWDRIIASYMVLPEFREFWETSSINLGADFRAYVDQLQIDDAYNFLEDND